MDECLPPLVRDNKYFMMPFFYFAYRGRNIRQVMNFKRLVYDFTEKQYDDFYNNLNTISRNRVTDLNKGCLDFILSTIKEDTSSVIDIGCGNGYLLKSIKDKFPNIELNGFDIKNENNLPGVIYTKGNIEKLPFADKSFDVVTCSHVLEHIVNIEKAISELKRITRRQLIIVVPRQRYYFYTLDEHVNFFPFKEKLTSVVNIANHACKNVHGDWAYAGNL
jgi:ubiquinone/menaquinone biosynthesis C-methylase UbiE